MNRKIPIVALGVALLATPFAFYLLGQGDKLPGVLRAGDDDYLRYHNQAFPVARVVDGGTVDLAVADNVTGQPATRIRLWGVDVPAPGGPRSVGADYFGAEAAEFTRRLLTGQAVRLLLIKGQTRDRNRRLLAYVFLPDGAMLNEELIRTGQGYADPRFPHDWLERFKSLERRAIKAKAGLWKDVRQDQLPAWRQRQSEPSARPGD